MQVTTDKIKELREKTGIGIMDCKKALTDCNGDLDAAIVLLREQGIAVAEKKKGRSLGSGLVESYIHSGGRIGALVEMNCETDFVARTPDFADLTHNVAMQVAAMNPKYISSLVNKPHRQVLPSLRSYEYNRLLSQIIPNDDQGFSQQSVLHFVFLLYHA